MTVGIALAAGMVAQALARHLRLPGIVLLVASGIVLGPDLLGVVMPELLGPALNILVGFAVAVILFEGGMNLDVRRLRREALVIRRLLIVGPFITWGGAALAARWLMGWDWRLAAAFGVLVIVTGPTVITPLLRRIRIDSSVATILEGEAVLIDAIGAVLAAVTLQVIVGASITEGVISILLRLAFGLACGLAGGFVIGSLLRIGHVVPEGLENVFTLSLVLVLFQLSNAFLPESGIMSVTVAGMLVGNMRVSRHRDLLEFKEQLTVMLIGLLFVLLAADVRVGEVVALGVPGVLTVACLMLAVRPLSVLVCTTGSSLPWRGRTFLAWLAPRGVVAAAMAALYAQSFEAAGISGGRALEALVFLVIAATVVVQGLSGGIVARLLGLRQAANRGYAILGINDVGLALGRELRRSGHEVLFVDSSPHACALAEKEDFRVVFGNGIEERTLQRAQLETRAAAIAVTTNDEVNLLFARHAREEFKVTRVHVAVRPDSGVTPAMIASHGMELLFGAPADVDAWSVRLRRRSAVTEFWRLETRGTTRPEVPGDLVLPLVHRRGTDARPAGRDRDPRVGDEFSLLIHEADGDAARVWLRANGFVPVEPMDPAAAELAASV